MADPDHLLAALNRVRLQMLAYEVRHPRPVRGPEETKAAFRKRSHEHKRQWQASPECTAGLCLLGEFRAELEKLPSWELCTILEQVLRRHLGPPR